MELYIYIGGMIKDLGHDETLHLYGGGWLRIWAMIKGMGYDEWNSIYGAMFKHMGYD
jgi:hypothetical protein